MAGKVVSNRSKRKVSNRSKNRRSAVKRKTVRRRKGLSFGKRGAKGLQRRGKKAKRI